MWFEIKNLLIQLALTAALLLSAAKISHAGQFTDCMKKHKATGRNSLSAATACVAITQHPKLTMEEFLGCIDKIRVHVPIGTATACSVLTVHRSITVNQFQTCMQGFIKARSDLDLPSSEVMAANACTLVLLRKTTHEDFGSCIDRYVSSTESTADEGSLACTVIHNGSLSPKQFIDCIDRTSRSLNYSDSISAEACKSLSGAFTI